MQIHRRGGQGAFGIRVGGIAKPKRRSADELNTRLIPGDVGGGYGQARFGGHASELGDKAFNAELAIEEGALLPTNHSHAARRDSPRATREYQTDSSSKSPVLNPPLTSPGKNREGQQPLERENKTTRALTRGAVSYQFAVCDLLHFQATVARATASRSSIIRESSFERDKQEI